jgi:hypothetical protein
MRYLPIHPTASVIGDTTVMVSTVVTVCAALAAERTV